MHAGVPHSHRSSMRLLTRNQTRNHTDDRGEHRTTLRGVPTPPPRLPKQTAPSRVPQLLTRAVGGVDSKAATSRGTPQTPTPFVDAMGTPTQRKLAVSNLRTSDPRHSSTLHRSREQGVDLPSRELSDLRERSVDEDMPSEVLFTCVRPGPGAALDDADRISRRARVLDGGYRGSVRDFSGPSGRKDASLIIDSPSGPLTLVANSANPRSTNTNSSNPTSMGIVSRSRVARLSPGSPALPEMVRSSAAAKAFKPKASLSSPITQSELVSSPLSLPRQASSRSPVSVPPYRSSRSQQDSSALLSSASRISVEPLHSSHRSRCENSAGSSSTDLRSSSSIRSLLGRRVHFLLGDPAQDGFTVADGKAASVKRNDDTRAPPLRHPADPAAVVLAPSDADQRLASPTNSSRSSSRRLTLSMLSDSSNVRLQLSRHLGKVETHPTLFSLPRGPSSPLLCRSGNTSVVSLRLNKKGRRIEAVPAFAQANVSCDNGRSASEVVGVPFHSAPSTAAPTGLSLALSGSPGTHGSAIYQPCQPLPKSALRQVSRYGKDEWAASSRTDCTLLQKGNVQWRWWQPRSATGVGMMSAAPPAPRLSASAMHRCFTNYLRGALVYRLRRRVHKPEALSTTLGRAPVAGGVAAEASTTPSSVRTGNSRGGRVESLVEWSLLSVAVLASFFLIFIDVFDN